MFFIAIAVFNFFRFRGPAGPITEIGSDFVIIRNPSNFQIKVIINNETVVRSGREIVEPESLRVGDFILIFGTRRNGTIDAEGITILENRPPMPR